MSAQGYSVPNPENPPATGSIDVEWYGPWARREYLNQQVTVASSAASQQLGIRLPPQTRLLWGALRSITAVSVVTGSSATGTPTAWAVVPSTASAMSTSVLASSTGTSFQGAVLISATDTASNSITHRELTNGVIDIGTSTYAVRANMFNTSTSEQFLYLVPVNVTAATNEHRFFVNAGGFAFSSNTAKVDVVLHFERFFSTKSA